MKRPQRSFTASSRAAAVVFRLVLFCFLILPVSVAASLSEEEVRDLVAGSPGKNEYPQAGALILYRHGKLRIEEDHSKVFESHLLVKILEDRARGFGDQKRTYDQSTDSVEVVVARTWLPDLTTVPVEPKAINVITPPHLVGATIYADIKQKVISFSSIAPGVVVEIKMRTISRPDSADQAQGIYPYWDYEAFRASEPILRAGYTLDLPADAPDPVFSTGGGLESPVREEKNGRKTITWQRRDVPMIHSIPYMPPRVSFAPHFRFSNITGWEALGKYLAGRFYPAAAPDEAVSEKAAELTSGCRTGADSVRAICLFVSVQVRNIDLSMGLRGYKPHPAGQVLQNMYGDQLDKTALLSSMLTAAGFENYPALTSARQMDVFDPSVPSTHQFSRMMVYVPGSFTDSTFTNSLYNETERNGLWLHPTAQYSRYGFFNWGQGNRALVILPGGGRLSNTQDFPPEKSLSLSTASLKLEATGDVEGYFETVTDGMFDRQERNSLMDLTPVELDQYFQRAANAVGEGTVKKSYTVSELRDLTAASRARLEFSAPELGIVQGDMMIVRIPQPPFGFSGMPYYPRLKEREFDFSASGPFVL
ncbi:MAG: DUF3857 domain-containing protein, partial [Gemmatimonadota bacterium]|nr:DUF3857 domain-containing protein [Gemmatimonadota bacterium]